MTSRKFEFIDSPSPCYALHIHRVPKGMGSFMDGPYKESGVHLLAFVIHLTIPRDTKTLFLNLGDKSWSLITIQVITAHRILFWDN